RNRNRIISWSAGPRYRSASRPTGRAAHAPRGNASGRLLRPAPRFNRHRTRAGRASAALIGATPSLSTAARLHHPCRPTRCGRPGKRGELVLPATAAIVAVLIRGGGRGGGGARLGKGYTGKPIEGLDSSPPPQDLFSPKSLCVRNLDGAGISATHAVSPCFWPFHDVPTINVGKNGGWLWPAIFIAYGLRRSNTRNPGCIAMAAASICKPSWVRAG